MTGPTKFKWTIEIEVAENLVADGADFLSPFAARQIADKLFPYAFGHEVSVTIVGRPDAAEIRRVQGYPADGSPADS